MPSLSLASSYYVAGPAFDGSDAAGAVRLRTFCWPLATAEEKIYSDLAARRASIFRE